MRLPHSDKAIVPIEKLRDYLLSPRHPIGRFKAAFFAGLGYTDADPARLEQDLRSQHLPLETEEGATTPYGRKFLITGPITGPAGGTATVVSVLVIHNSEDVPRFVTAYPGGD